MISLDELMADARWNELLWMTRYTANVKKSTKKKKALYFVRMSQRFFIHLLLFCCLLVVFYMLSRCLCLDKRQKRTAVYCIKNLNVPMFFNAMPVRRTTARRGSSATWTGSLVFAWIRLSNPRNNAPPPVRQIPVW